MKSKIHKKQWMEVSFGIVLMALFIIYTVNDIYADGMTDLSTVSHLQKYLKLDDFITYLVKGVAHLIYIGLSALTNMVESGFMLLARFDMFASIKELSIFRDNINILIGSVFMIGLGGIVLVRMFQLKETMSVLYNAFIVGFALLLFSTFVTLANDGRIAFTSEIEQAIGQNATTSQRVFLDQTYDLKYLIAQAKDGNKVTLTLIEQGLSEAQLEYIRWDERLSKDDLGYKYVLNERTGEKEAVRVIDGMWGIGDERYFRYHTQYFNINVILAVTFFVYFVALIKLGGLVYDLVTNELLGKFGVLKGLDDLNAAGKPYLTFVQTIVSILILTVLASIYPTIASGVLSQSDEALPFFIKVIALFAAGLVILHGSDFLDKVFGFQNGRRTMATAFAMAGAGALLYRGAKKAGRGVKNKLSGDGKGQDDHDNDPNKGPSNDTSDTDNSKPVESPEGIIANGKGPEETTTNGLVSEEGKPSESPEVPVHGEGYIPKDGKDEQYKPEDMANPQRVPSDETLREDWKDSESSSNKHDLSDQNDKPLSHMEDWEIDEYNLYESNLPLHDKKYGGATTAEEKKARYEAYERSKKGDSKPVSNPEKQVKQTQAKQSVPNDTSYHKAQETKTSEAIQDWYNEHLASDERHSRIGGDDE
ncbi:hypothetical protein [Erysipelothrix aquatica]|uniref:hypothetical protein n=1 Tax=Erysipelothrix aquatica TaxID=2683714 RepID=UPI0013571DD2|nr:hypothetical protein [Erysipelothrix aquatica]